MNFNGKWKERNRGKNLQYDNKADPFDCGLAPSAQDDRIQCRGGSAQDDISLSRGKQTKNARCPLAGITLFPKEGNEKAIARNTKKQSRVMALLSCIAVFLCAVLLGCAFFGNRNFNQNNTLKADAATTIAGDLLLSSPTNSKLFDGDNMQLLLNKLAGKSKAQMSDIETLVNGGYRDMSYLRTLNGNKPITITLDGKEFMIVYLSKADYDGSFMASGNPLDTNDTTKKGDILLTLIQKDSSQFVEWNKYKAGKVTNTYWDVNYGASYIRSVGLNAGTPYVTGNGTYATPGQATSGNPWVKFTVPSVTGNITKYLAKAKYSKLLAYECWMCNMANNSQTNGANEAWDFPGGDGSCNHGFNSQGGTPSQYVDVTYEQYYSDWKNDYVWIPSYPEMGELTSSPEGVYNLIQSDRASNDRYWLRTIELANTSRAGCAYFVSRAGSPKTTLEVTDASAVAQGSCMLNLSEILRSGTGLPTGAVPSDVTMTYDGQDHEFSDKFSTFWNANTAFQDSTKVQITYKDSQGNAVTKMKEADTYTISLKLLTDDLIWPGTAADAANQREKTVKLIINKKQVPLLGTFTVDSAGTATYSVDTSQFISTDTEANNRRPTWEVVFTGDGNYNSTTPPTKQGSYTATLQFKWATGAPENYEWSQTYSAAFTKGLTPVAPPAVATTDLVKTYTGEEQSFAVTGFDGTKMTVTAPTTPAGASWDGTASTAKATNVGKYTFTVGLTDTDSYCWDDAQGGTGGRTIEVEIKPAALSFTATRTDDTGWSWEQGTAAAIDLAMTGVLKPQGTSETILAQFYYQDAVKLTKTPAGSLSQDGTVTLADPSSLATAKYNIIVELPTTTAANANYSVTTIIQAFTVTTKTATCTDSDIHWQFERSGGAATPLVPAGGTGYTVDGSTYVFVYNKDDIIVSIDTSQLPTGVELYTTAAGYTNGYQGTTNRNANAAGTTYTTKVIVRAMNNGVFSDTNTATKEFTITWRIDKAKYNYTAQWASDNASNNFTYTGNPIKNELENLPTGLTAMYSGSSGIDAGSYTAKVTSFATSDANYELPNVNDAQWTKAWTISKRKISVTWTNQQTQDSGSTTYFLPVLSDSSVSSYIDYKYYEDDSDSPAATAIDISQVTVPASSEKKYWVEVVLADNADVQKNFELVDTTNLTHPNYIQFTVGSTKTIVRVDIEGSGHTYDGSSHFGFKIKAGTLQESSYKIQIAEANPDGSAPAQESYKEINLTTGENMPVKVGKYIISVDLASNDAQYNYLPDRLFNYEILPAEFDLSQLKWVDENNGNTPYSVPYVYEAKYIRDENGEYVLDADGNKQLKITEHKMVLMNGTDVLTLQTDGKGDYYAIEFTLKDGSKETLKMYVKSSNTEGENSNVQDGGYTIALEYDYDKDNFAAPAFADTFTWEIQKAQLDMTNVHWDYTEPFTYTADEEGTAKTFRVGLVGLPDYLDSIVSYQNNESASAQKLKASYTFAGFEAGNFEALVTPPGFSETLDWEVQAREFIVPASGVTELVFRDDGYDFIEELGYIAEWANYLTLSVTKDYEPYPKGDFEDELPCHVLHVGLYTLTINLKSGLNEASGAKKNVQWSDGSVSLKAAQFQITPLTLVIRDWTGDTKGDSAVIELDGANAPDPSAYVTYRFTKEELYANGGTEVTVADEWNTHYYKEAVIKSEYAGDVEIEVGAGAQAYYDFTTGRNPNLPPPAQPNKPKFVNDTVVYNGEEIVFELENYDETLMQFATGSDELTQKNVGEYTLTIMFKKNANAVWKETGTTESVTLKFYVKILELEIPTVDENALKYTGEEQTYLPEGYLEKYMTIRDNVGTNADTYVLIVGLKDPVNTVWKITAESVSYKTALGYKVTLEGEDEATSDKRLEWKINRAVIGTEWNSEGEVPKLKLTESEQSMVEYTFYDAKGNPVPVEKLRKGTEYRVQASLKDKYKQNYEFENAEVSYQLPMDGTFQFGGASGDFSFDTFITDWWWVILVAVLALLFIILLIVLLKRRKKKEEAVTAVAQTAPAEVPAPAPAQTAVTPAAAQQAPMPAPERVYLQAEHSPMPPMAQQGMGYGYPNGVNPMLQQQQMMAQQMAAQQQMQMQAQQQQMQDMQTQKILREIQMQKMQNQQLMMQLRNQQMQMQAQQQPPVQAAPAPAAPAPTAPAAPQVIVIDTKK